MGFHPRRFRVTFVEMLRPDVMAYLDYRRFLSDWFEWKKNDNPRYSHRLFARKASVRSPSLLLLVTEGKRNLSATTTAGFLKAVGLEDAEARHFTLLVRLDQGETAEERSEALQEILATKRFREARRLDAAAVRYFGTWWFPAIHELARRPDFRADPVWVARHLRPRVTEAEAADALDALLELGLIAHDDHGIPRPTDESVVTPHEVADVALGAYHVEMLRRAGDAVGKFDQDQRHLLGLTVAIPAHLVDEVKARLNEVQRELLALCDQEPREQVYQLSIAFFPLSDALGEE